MSRVLPFKINFLKQPMTLLVLLAMLGGCASSSEDEKPYICKAVSPEEEDGGGHGGHFFSDPNPSQAKLIALRMCREHHNICFIQYCNHDFKVRKF